MQLFFFYFWWNIWPHASFISIESDSKRLPQVSRAVFWGRQRQKGKTLYLIYRRLFNDAQ